MPQSDAASRRLGEKEAIGANETSIVFLVLLAKLISPKRRTAFSAALYILAIISTSGS